MRHIVDFASSRPSSWGEFSTRRARGNRAGFAFLAFLAVLGAGCEHDAFVLDITVDGDGFQRQLTAWHVKGSGDESEPQIAPIDSEMLARLEKLYGSSRTIEEGRKHVFAGHFRETTPKDVGGYGSLIRIESPLGDVTFYDERFRGSADLEQQLADRRAAVDELIDLAIGWLRSEMGNDEDFGKLETMLDQRLRHDLKNMATYAWTGAALSQFHEGDSREMAYRAWQYACEQDYFRVSELPTLIRAVTTAERDPQRLLRAVQRVAARQIGVPDDQPIPKSLAWLADSDRLKRSLEEYLRRTETYKASYRQWQASRAEDPEQEEPDPTEVVVGGIIVRILGLEFPGNGDTVEVHLHGVREPFETNGQWDGETAQVTWSHQMSSNPLAAFSYATCADPCEDFQREHFGRVLLTGEKLAEYAVWYNGLDAKESVAWDEFVGACRPSEQLRSRIESYRLPGESDESAPLSDVPRRLLVEALDGS